VVDAAGIEEPDGGLDSGERILRVGAKVGGDTLKRVETLLNPAVTGSEVIDG
jgi:hypothetical protein